MAALRIWVCISAVIILCDAKLSQKDWRQLGNIHDLFQKEISEIKIKVWGEVSTEIENLKDKLDAALLNGSCVGQNFIEKDREENSDVKNHTQMEEEQLQRKFEDNMDMFISQKFSVISKALQSEKIKNRKLKAELLEVKSTFSDFKKEMVTLVESLQEQISTNRDQNKNMEQTMEDINAEHRTFLETQEEMTDELSENIERVSKLYEKRSAFGKPGFVSKWFLMKSQDDTLSDLTIAHGLGSLPYKVDVQTRATGDDRWWIYPGVSAFQADDDYPIPYGGVVYFYNESHVTVFAPKKRNQNNNKGRIIYTGPIKYKGQDHKSLSEAYVRVKVWGPENLPVPDFQSEWLPVDITNKTTSFYDIKHSLENYPALVSVYVRVSKGNFVMVSDGIGATVNPKNGYSGFGGVIWAYSSGSVRLWTLFAEKSNKDYEWQTVMGDKDGWGKDKATYFDAEDLDNLKQGDVKVIAWSQNHFSPGTNYFQCEGNTKSIQGCASMGRDSLETDLFLLSVQAEDGDNKGFRFSGYGGAQAQNHPYGGVVYAYSRNGGIRVWSPDPNQHGYAVHIHSPYGNGVNVQATNNVSYVITWIKS